MALRLHVKAGDAAEKGRTHRSCDQSAGEVGAAPPEREARGRRTSNARPYGGRAEGTADEQCSSLRRERQGGGGRAMLVPTEGEARGRRMSDARPCGGRGKGTADEQCSSLRREGQGDGGRAMLVPAEGGARGRRTSNACPCGGEPRGRRTSDARPYRLLSAKEEGWMKCQA